MSLISLDSLIPFLLLSTNIVIRIWYIWSSENLRSCFLFHRGAHLSYCRQLFGRTFLLLHVLFCPILPCSRVWRPPSIWRTLWAETLYVEDVGGRLQEDEEGWGDVQVWTGRGNHAKFPGIAVIRPLIRSLILIKQKFDVYFKPSNVRSTRDKDEQANMVPALWVCSLHGRHQRNSLSATRNPH